MPQLVRLSGPGVRVPASMSVKSGFFPSFFFFFSFALGGAWLACIAARKLRLDGPASALPSAHRHRCPSSRLVPANGRAPLRRQRPERLSVGCWGVATREMGSTSASKAPWPARPLHRWHPIPAPVPRRQIDCAGREPISGGQKEERRKHEHCKHAQPPLAFEPAALRPAEKKPGDQRKPGRTGRGMRFVAFRAGPRWNRMRGREGGGLVLRAGRFSFRKT